MRDADCLATMEALLVDGANGVCRDVRLDAPSGHAGHALALVIAALVLAGWLRASRVPARIRRAALLALAVLAAAPGAFAMLALRADRPSARAETARRSMLLYERLNAFGERHQCVSPELVGCDECLPVLRLALARTTCEPEPRGVPRIILHPGALDAVCEEDDRALVCGRPR